MSINTKCQKCGCVSYIGQDTCKEHYYELHNLPVDFYKIKEKMWRNFIVYTLKNNWGINVIWNKKLIGTNLIPDFHFLFYDVLFLIEIDEYQHSRSKYYSDESENKRYNQLGGIENIIVIRINPDAYRNNPSIWVKDVRIISPGNIEESIVTNNEEFDKRKNIFTMFINNKLSDIIINYKNESRISRFFKAMKTSVEIPIYYLFFD